MKRLNITKERFNSSRYFQTKYGRLRFVSESGHVYRTDKGNVIQFVNKNNTDVINEVFESISKFLNESNLITESDRESEKEKVDDLKETVSNNINSPEDVKKFIEKNDKVLMEKIKDEQPILKKAWEGLKTIVSYGWKGFKFLVENWKEVIIIIVLASCFIFGWETTATWIIKGAWKVLTFAAEVIGDAAIDVAKSVGKAGDAISTANVASGGYGGWTGMGLGGGLR